MGLEDLEMSLQGEPPSSIPDESANSLLYNSRCCFCFPSRRRRSGSAWWERFRSSSTGPAHDDGDPWWSRGVRTFKKIREWSEIVAGPKWKTFIRRFNRNKSTSGSNARHGQFQYDPLSYALNFDEGSADFQDEDDYGGFRDFSSRYAAVSVSMNASGSQVIVA